MFVLGVRSFSLMNVDLFPALDQPVVIVIYNSPRLSAIDMERRIVLITTVTRVYTRGDPFLLSNFKGNRIGAARALGYPSRRSRAKQGTEDR
jgi:hypothetical protein